MSDFNPTPGHVNVITAENIETARPHLPPDQGLRQGRCAGAQKG